MVFNEGGVVVLGRQEQPSPIYSSMKMDNYIMDLQLSTKVGTVVREDQKKQ